MERRNRSKGETRREIREGLFKPQIPGNITFAAEKAAVGLGDRIELVNLFRGGDCKERKFVFTPWRRN